LSQRPVFQTGVREPVADGGFSLCPVAGVGKPHANNNRVERLNGTLRERVKVQRGWKSYQTPLVEGQRIAYNFVKPHMVLEGQTPSQAAGLAPKGWRELLEKALATGSETPEENTT
jgi:hypothetical protein